MTVCSKPIEVTIDDCLMCPFLYANEVDERECAHPRWERTQRWIGLRTLPPKRRGSRWTPPKWCPLRRRPVLVELGRRV